MSLSTVCYMTVCTKNSSHTSEISTQVACNTECVQGKRSCKHEGKICVCKRCSVDMGVCMCVCPASSLSRQQLLVCVCVYMYANTAERLRSHKAVILLLIMKYFVLKMISYSHTTAPCNLFSSSRKKSQTLSPDMPIIILPSIIREA